MREFNKSSVENTLSYLMFIYLECLEMSLKKRNVIFLKRFIKLPLIGLLLLLFYTAHSASLIDKIAEQSPNGFWQIHKSDIANLATFCVFQCGVCTKYRN